MAALDGVTRLYLLAKRITFWGFIAAGLFWLFAVTRGRAGLLELLVLLAFPLILGSVLWTVAWIIEGFVVPPPPDARRDQTWQQYPANLTRPLNWRQSLHFKPPACWGLKPRLASRLPPFEKSHPLQVRVCDVGYVHQLP